MRIPTMRLTGFNGIGFRWTPTVGGVAKSFKTISETFEDPTGHPPKGHREDMNIQVKFKTTI